jgi:hypothetical protein
MHFTIPYLVSSASLAPYALMCVRPRATNTMSTDTAVAAVLLSLLERILCLMLRDQIPYDQGYNTQGKIITVVHTDGLIDRRT